MSNKEIRDAIIRSGLRYWEVAKGYPCGEGTFCRKLRDELEPSEKAYILAVIERLKVEKEQQM